MNGGNTGHTCNTGLCFVSFNLCFSSILCLRLHFIRVVTLYKSTVSDNNFYQRLLSSLLPIDHKLRLHTSLISVRLHFISRVFQEFYTLSYYIIIDTKAQMSVRDKILSVFSDDNYMSFHLKLNLF